jgi:glycosyltransferase involved in cell wall biosynthesis
VHIVHLVDKFRDGGVHGGLSTVVAEETHALAARGHRITVVARRFAADVPLRETLDGVEIIRFDSANALDTFRQVRNVVQQTMADHPIDIVHGHMATIDFSATVSLPKGIPVVRSFHGDWPMEVWAEKQDQARGKFTYYKDLLKRALQERIERRSMANARHIVVLSNFSRQYVMQKYKRKSNVISVIAPGIDRKRFYPVEDRQALRRSLGLPELARIILFTGRLIAWKGPQRLIEAFAQIAASHPDAVLVLAGKGNLEPALRAQIAERGLEPRTIFAGFQHERIPLYYAAADVMVVPSTREETFGMVTIEALSSGCPVLGSPYGATPELLNAVDPRLVLGSSEPGAIAASLHRFFAEGLVERLEPKQLHDHVSKCFSWETHSAALILLYERCIAAASSRS